MSIKLIMVVTFMRGIWLQGEKGEFCFSELFKIKMNPYIASKLSFLKYVLKRAFKADSWVALMLTWGSMFIAARCTSTLTCCTSHALSNPVHVEGGFSTSRVLLSCIWHLVDHFEMLIPGKGTFSLKFYLLIALGTPGVISWGVSRFQMFFVPSSFQICPIFFASLITLSQDSSLV